MQTSADRMDESTVMAEVSAVEFGDRHKKRLPLFSFTCPSNLEPSRDQVGISYLLFEWEHPWSCIEMHITPLNLFLVSSVLTWSTTYN